MQESRFFAASNDPAASWQQQPPAQNPSLQHAGSAPSAHHREHGSGLQLNLAQHPASQHHSASSTPSSAMSGTGSGSGSRSRRAFALTEDDSVAQQPQQLIPPPQPMQRPPFISNEPASWEQQTTRMGSLNLSGSSGNSSVQQQWQSQPQQSGGANSGWRDAPGSLSDFPPPFSSHPFSQPGPAPNRMGALQAQQPQMAQPQSGLSQLSPPQQQQQLSGQPTAPRRGPLSMQRHQQQQQQQQR